VASQPRNSAREERRIEIRRLLIASFSSAAAAVIVSQFWVKGTWLAAAMTPVFVILIQEMLHRPVDVVADRFTSDRTALMPDGAEVLPEGTGAGAPPPARQRTRQTVPHSPPTRAPAEPGSGRGDAAPPVRVYRTGAGGGSSRPRTRKRKLAIGTIVVTALLAFAISAFAITGTELLTGGSIGKSPHRTTLFGGGSNTTTTQDQNQSTTQQQPQQNEQTTPSQGQNQQTTPRQGGQQNQKTTPGSSSGGTPTAPAPQTTAP
jgi:hypothetical protein